jgi:uncharacterized protein YneF (UPF0154 family)
MVSLLFLGVVGVVFIVLLGLLIGLFVIIRRIESREENQQEEG